MKFIPYLVFKGNAEQALNYYKVVLEGQITNVQRFSDMKTEPTPEAYKNYVLHGELRFGDLVIYFSDSPQGVAMGDNVTLLLDCSSEAEVDRLYKALSVDAEIHMPLQKTFWNAKYANIKDKFGVTWQLNYQY